MDAIQMEQIQAWLAICISAGGVVALVWKFVSYVNKKTKCFELQKQTIKDQDGKIENLQNDFDDLKNKVGELKSEVHEETNLGRETHKEIFKRLDDQGEKISFLAGRFGWKKNSNQD